MFSLNFYKLKSHPSKIEREFVKPLHKPYRESPFPLFQIKFTTANGSYGGPCVGGGGAGHYQSGELRVQQQQEGAGLGEGVAMVAVELGAGLQHHPGHALYYLCVREAGSSSYTHQGHHKQVTVETRWGGSNALSYT